jgi:hypothetical protein
MQFLPRVIVAQNVKPSTYFEEQMNLLRKNDPLVNKKTCCGISNVLLPHLVVITLVVAL